VRAVEHDRAVRAGRHLGQGTEIHHEFVVAERNAALGDKNARVPRVGIFWTTFVMSHGARNWPFLTFTVLPVSPAATSRSVWRDKKAGICSTSTASAAGAHWSGR
jgi:hypothetical protein